MKLYVYKENASGEVAFTRTGDAVSYDKESNIYAVADSPLRHLVREIREYPFEDYGYIAAKTFCNSFVKHSREVLENDGFSEEKFKHILLKTNSDIKKQNKLHRKKYKDPLNYDILETVGVGALIYNGTLYYGGVGDCFVKVFRKSDYENIAAFHNQVETSLKYIYELKKQGKLKDYVPEDLKQVVKTSWIWEPCWCNYLRNNPEAKNDKGERIGWGCFTGEKGLESFLEIHKLKLEEGDIITLYSDGMIPLINDKIFFNWLNRNVESTFTCQHKMREKIMQTLKKSRGFWKERTLVYLKYI